MSNEVGMGICRVDVFDGEAWSAVDGLTPPADAFYAYVPLFLAAPVEVKRDGKPFLRVELATPPPGVATRFLSTHIVAAISDCLEAHGPYVACTDATAYERRRPAASAWVASLPALPEEPMLRWRGRDVVTPLVGGVLERLLGSFSLVPEHAVALVASMPGAPPQAQVEQLAVVVAKGGTWPKDLDGATLDEEARQVAEANRRSDEARERNAREAARIVDLVVGEEGIEGFRCRVGCTPPFEHLATPRNALGGGPAFRPPSLVQGGWQYWLRRQIPGEPLTEFALPDGSGMIPRDTVLRMTKGQLAAAVSGCWADVHTVRAMRGGHGVIDRRPIRDDEFIGAGDPRIEALQEHADAIVAEYRGQLWAPLSAPWLRLHVVSALVRGLLLRPDLAAARILASSPTHQAADGMPDEARRVQMAGTFNVAGLPEPGDIAPAVAPRAGWKQDEIEAACVAAADGDPLWAVMSPGVLLEPLKPTLLERLASVVRQDPWEPVLRAALRGREDERFRSDEVCKFVGADVERVADTSRIKKIMAKLRFEKREFEVNGDRFRAYARAS